MASVASSHPHADPWIFFHPYHTNVNGFYLVLVCVSSYLYLLFLKYNVVTVLCFPALNFFLFNVCDCSLKRSLFAQHTTEKQGKILSNVKRVRKGPKIYHQGGYKRIQKDHHLDFQKSGWNYIAVCITYGARCKCQFHAWGWREWKLYWKKDNFNIRSTDYRLRHLRRHLHKCRVYVVQQCCISF